MKMAELLLLKLYYFTVQKPLYLHNNHQMVTHALIGSAWQASIQLVKYLHLNILRPTFSICLEFL